MAASDKKLKWKGKLLPVLSHSSGGVTGSCSHQTVIKDMCADCGKDLRSLTNETSLTEQPASISMVHCVPELVISQQEAVKLAKKDQERLLKSRKLVLLVDLDQTILHTTNDLIPPNLLGVYHFQHPVSNLASSWYHTKFRPHTTKFLESISSLYELHICTFGSRQYAHTIARFLDPDGKFFSHRILSRDEFANEKIKSGNLQSLFPCGDAMVCIIDDREDVWNFPKNLVHVKPYIFFQGTADINAPPGLNKTNNDEREVKHRVRKVSCSKDGKILEVHSVDGLCEKNKQGVAGDMDYEISADKPDTLSIDDSTEKYDEVVKVCLVDMTEVVTQVLKGKKDSLDVTTDIDENSEKRQKHCGDLVESNVAVLDNLNVQVENNITAKKENNSDIKNLTVPSEKVTDQITSTAELPSHQSESNVKEAIKEADKTETELESVDVTTDNAKPAVAIFQSDNTVIGVDNSVNNTEVSKNDESTEKTVVESMSNVEDSTDDNTDKPTKDDFIVNDPKSLESVVDKSDDVSDNTENRDGIYEQIEWVDDDDYLYYLEDILKKVHKTFYKFLENEKSETLPTLKDIIPYIKSKVLKGVNVLFSGVVPTNMAMEKSRAYLAAQALGATIHTSLYTKSDKYEKSKRTTHVVAARFGTAKVKKATSTKGIHIVTPEWLWACYERWERVDERLFVLTENNQIPIPIKNNENVRKSSRKTRNGKRKLDKVDESRDSDSSNNKYDVSDDNKADELLLGDTVIEQQQLKKLKTEQEKVSKNGHTNQRCKDNRNAVYDRVTGKRIKQSVDIEMNEENKGHIAYISGNMKDTVDEIADLTANVETEEGDELAMIEGFDEDGADEGTKPTSNENAVTEIPTFAETVNPLLMFTEYQIIDMDKEVEEMLSNESNNSSSETDEEERDRKLRKAVLSRQRNDSSSEDSLSGGSYPRGWGISKRVKSRSCSSESYKDDNEMDNEQNASEDENKPLEFEESESEPLGKIGMASSESDIEFHDSVGSVDDEIAEAVQREFLSQL